MPSNTSAVSLPTSTSTVPVQTGNERNVRIPTKYKSAMAGHMFWAKFAGPKVTFCVFQRLVAELVVIEVKVLQVAELP